MKRQNIRNTLLKRITIDANICHGKPCIRGMRYPLELILELLSSGMTTDQILEDYEDLELDDIQVTFLYAAKSSHLNRDQYTITACDNK